MRGFLLAVVQFAILVALLFAFAFGIPPLRYYMAKWEASWSVQRESPKP